MIHALKIYPDYFRAVREGKKRFELRRNDRYFREGDYLALNEWDGQHYTGRTELAEVTYLLNPNEAMTCASGFVVMSIERAGAYDSPAESQPADAEGPDKEG